MDTFTTAVLLVVALFSKGQGFPSGGPYKSCANLYPKHNTDAQTTAPPYTVSVNVTTYDPGDEIEVILSGLDGATFKGFMVRANRVTGDTEEIVGEWFDLPVTANSRNWYPQQDNITNCVTHNSPDLKSEVILHWRLGNETLGDIIIYASFVESYDTFWVFVPSQVITANVAPDSTKSNESISTDSEPLDFTECGITKGCMLYPLLCDPAEDECTLAVTYKSHAHGVDFEAMAPQKGYLTFAFSADTFMGDDETVTCISTSKFDSVQHGYNPSYYNDRHRITGFTNLETARIDGTLQCRWTMPYVNTIIHLKESADSLPVAETHSFDLHENWHVFLAYGRIYAGADVLAKHKVLPIVSSSLVDFQDISTVKAYGLYLPMKIHAMLMMLGFMVLMGISVVVSRHYRNVFSKEIMGLQTWFQVHRAMMVVAATLILISFVVIFATVRKWSEAGSTHAVLGTLTVVLLLLQILAGVLRPGTESRFRPVFYWVHTINGKLTQLLSVVTIWLSFSVTYLNPYLKANMFPVFLLWMFMLLFWEGVVLEVYKLSHKNKDQSTATGTSQEMTELNDGRSVVLGQRCTPTSKFLCIQIIMYSCCISAVTLLGIAFLFIY